MAAWRAAWLLLGLCGAESGRLEELLGRDEGLCSNETALGLMQVAALAAHQASVPPRSTTAPMSAKDMKRLDVDGIAAFERTWLGMPRDFWILVGLCCCVLVFFLVQTSVVTRVAIGWRAEVAAAAGKPCELRFARGNVRRLLKWLGCSAQSAAMLDMAGRTALACCLLGTSYWVPSWGGINRACFTMQQAAVVLIFSVEADLGRSIRSWWECFLGHLLPALHVIMMFHLFPLGSKQRLDRAWCFGVADFAAFSAVFLTLNWPANTCLFALSLQVGYTMDFLNPESVTVYSDGFDTLYLTGAEIGPLASSLVGFVAMLLLLPWGAVPSALGHAQEEAARLVWQQGALWQKAAACLCGDARRAGELAQLAKAARRCQEELEAMQDFAEPSWWECWDSGLPARTRAHLLELQEQAEDAGEWLLGAVACLEAQDFDEEHRDFMGKVGGSLGQLLTCSQQLFFTGACLAIRGVDANEARWAQEIKALRAKVAEVEEAQRGFAEALAAVRKELLKGPGLVPRLVEKHAFAFAVSYYAEHSLSLARYLWRGSQRPGVPLRAAVLGRMASIWQLKEDRGQFSRACFAYLASACIGYVGIRDVISPYDGAIASTVAFMVPVSGVNGSPLLNNMRRFMGVAGGTLMGRLLFLVFCPCTWWGPFTAFGSTFLYELFTGALMFGASSYAFMGRLAAGFGAQRLLKVCFGRGSGVETFGLFQTQLLGLVFSAAADVIVGNSSASDVALREWQRYAELSFSSLGWLAGEEGISTDYRAPRRRLAEHRRAAGSHARAALEEPRLAGPGFNQQLWQGVAELIAQSGNNVALLMAAAASCSSRPQQLAVLKAALGDEAFKEMSTAQRRLRLQTLACSMKLLAAEGTPGMAMQEPLPVASMEQVVSLLCTKAVAELLLQQKACGSAREEAYCLLSLLAFLLRRSGAIHRDFDLQLHAALSPLP